MVVFVSFAGRVVNPGVTQTRPLFRQGLPGDAREVLEVPRTEWR